MVSHSRPVLFIPRLVLLACGIFGLIAGLNAALDRASLPALGADGFLSSLHGPLMVHGFLLVVIGIERAVALQANGSSAGFIVPALAAIGSFTSIVMACVPKLRTFLMVLPVKPGLIWLAALIGLIIIQLLLWQRRHDTSIIVELVGLVAWTEGTLLWTLALDTSRAALWWALGLVLFITGERLDLARIHLSETLNHVVLWLSLGILVSLSLSLLYPSVASIPLGLLIAVLAVVMARYDIARRTWKTGGVSGFSGTAMLTGWAWVAAAGLAIAIIGWPFSGYGFDALVHSLTIGFVLSMLLAHVPVIFPAIIHHHIALNAGAWAGLILLHAGLLIRIASGMRGALDGWRFGVALGIGALIVFATTTIASTIQLHTNGSYMTPRDQKKLQLEEDSDE